jgi:hypothetical protein
LNLVAAALVREMQGVDVQAISRRHEWKPGKHKWGGEDYQDGLKRQIYMQSDVNLQKLLVEMALQNELQVYRYGSPTPAKDLLDTAKRYGIDAEAIKLGLEAELVEKQKGKDGRDKKKTKKKAAAAQT